MGGVGAAKPPRRITFGAAASSFGRKTARRGAARPFVGNPRRMELRKPPDAARSAACAVRAASRRRPRAHRFRSALTERVQHLHLLARERGLSPLVAQPLVIRARRDGEFVPRGECTQDDRGGQTAYLERRQRCVVSAGVDASTHHVAWPNAAPAIASKGTKRRFAKHTRLCEQREARGGNRCSGLRLGSWISGDVLRPTRCRRRAVRSSKVVDFSPGRTHTTPASRTRDARRSALHPPCPTVDAHPQPWCLSRPPRTRRRRTHTTLVEEPNSHRGTRAANDACVERARAIRSTVVPGRRRTTARRSR